MEESESRCPKGISEAGIRQCGASSAQLVVGDAWHAEMRALPLTCGTTGGTGFGLWRTTWCIAPRTEEGRAWEG